RTLRQNSKERLPIDPEVRHQIGLAIDMQAPPAPSDQVLADEADARQALAESAPEFVEMLTNNPEVFVATPKNPFFAYDVSFLKNSPRYELDADYRQKVDELMARIAAGRRYYAYPDEWKYHAARLAAQGDLTLAEREDIDGRIRGYRRSIA